MASSRCAHAAVGVAPSGEFDEDDKYAWVGLARRVDIDRVFRVIKDSSWFQIVEAVGSTVDEQ